MTKVSGGGQRCVVPLINRLHNVAVTGLNRTCVLKTSYVNCDCERVDNRFAYIVTCGVGALGLDADDTMQWITRMTRNTMLPAKMFEYPWHHTLL